MLLDQAAKTHVGYHAARMQQIPPEWFLRRISLESQDGDMAQRNAPPSSADLQCDLLPASQHAPSPGHVSRNRRRLEESIRSVSPDATCHWSRKAFARSKVYLCRAWQPVHLKGPLARKPLPLVSSSPSHAMCAAVKRLSAPVFTGFIAVQRQQKAHRSNS